MRKLNGHSYSHHINEAMRACTTALSNGLKCEEDDDGEPIPLSADTLDKLQYVLKAFDRLRPVWEATIQTGRA